MLFCFVLIVDMRERTARDNFPDSMVNTTDWTTRGEREVGGKRQEKREGDKRRPREQRED